MKNVAVVYGGNSSEYEVSIKSGRYAASVIDRNIYNVYEVLLRDTSWKVVRWEGDQMETLGEIDKSDFSFDGVHFDAACLLIHGTPGENGLLQGYLEMMHVPFTTCNAFVSAVAFSKYSCKTFLRGANILMAREAFVHKGDDVDSEAIVAELGLPLFVKPSDGGSSFGVTKVKDASELPAALEHAFKEGDTALVEEFIAGRELTQGVYLADGKINTLPITEIVSQNEYFDYEAKYLGKSSEICPAPISEDLAAEVSKISVEIFRFLGCKGLIRIDYIANEKGVYFLEINTSPGMTSASLVPAMVRVAGMDITQFYTDLIEDCIHNS